MTTLFDEYRRKLKAILLQRSVKTGTFTLTSGRQSDFYVDVKQTSLTAEGAFLIGKLMYHMVQQNDVPIKAVGGMTLGADPIVTAISLASYTNREAIPAFIVRKEAKGHGTNNFIEGLDNFSGGPDTHVAIVEDVCTTGGTLLKVIDRIHEQGISVGLIMTVVDRQEGATEALAARGYLLQSIFTREELLAK